MSSRVIIKNLATLERFRGQLAECQAQLIHALDAASLQAQRVLGQIGERVIYWRRQKAAWQNEAERRLADFRRCQASDPPRDCREPYERWAEAARLAAQATGDLKEAEHQYARVETAITEYDAEKQRLTSTVGHTVSGATAKLSHVVAKARRVHDAPLGGTVLARAGTVFTAAGRAPPAASSAGAALHQPNPAEGEGREGEPAPETTEGVTRLPLGGAIGTESPPVAERAREGPGSPERGW